MSLTKLLPAALVILFFSGCLGGCAAVDPEARATNVATNIQALKDARFYGDLEVDVGGSPFGLGTSTFFWLGPQNMIFRAKGSADFRTADDATIEAIRNAGMLPVAPRPPQ